MQLNNLEKFFDDRPRGIAAKIKWEKCVGCGKCVRECPASIIQIQEVE